MRGRRWARLGLIALFGAGLFGLGRGDGPLSPAASAPVSVGTARAGERLGLVSAPGAVRPTRSVEIGYELAGTLSEVLAEEGDRVARGQPLARLDPSGLEAALARERAQLAVAEAEVRRARGAAGSARAALARFRQIADRSGGKVPSAREMSIAVGEAAQAEAVEAVARAALSQAHATVRSAEASLRKTTLRSPIEGVVLARRAHPGQVLAAGAAVTLFRLAEKLTTVELEANVDQAEVGKVKVGQRATVTIDAWPGRRYDGILTRIGMSPRAHEGTVAYPATIRLENQDLGLRVGMTGTAEIATAAVAPARS